MTREILPITVEEHSAYLKRNLSKDFKIRMRRGDPLEKHAGEYFPDTFYAESDGLNSENQGYRSMLVEKKDTSYCWYALTDWQVEYIKRMQKVCGSHQHAYISGRMCLDILENIIKEVPQQ